MAPRVRVVGRIDLAQRVCAELRAAGLEVQLATGGPFSELTQAKPPGEVDVVIATSLFDLINWQLGKRKHPGRPMVAVGEARREGALRGAVGGAVGPDSYVSWPASGVELAAAVDRAAAAVGRQRRWNGADASRALVWMGLVAGGLSGGVGYLVAGIAALAGLRYAWNRTWSLVGGIVSGAVGAALVGEWLARHWR